MDPTLFPETPRVLDLRPTPNCGKRVAFADVEVETAHGAIAFFDCTLFQSEAGTFSAGAPSKPNPFPGPGRAKFVPLVRWHPDLQQSVTDAVTDAYRLYSSGLQSGQKPTFQGEVRRRANLPAERPNAERGDYGRSGGRR